MRLEFSTSEFVLREIVSPKAFHTTMPASITSATSLAPWKSLQRVFSTTRNTNMYTNRLMTGKITDQKNPMDEPT
jgi:hypothetical protein